MEDFRSKSFNDERMQVESYNNNNNNEAYDNNSNTIPTGLQGLRCHSASYATATSSSYANDAQMQNVAKEVKFQKGKSANASSSRNWSFSDPELRRKRRVASYKIYTVEGNVKGSLRKSFRWVKQKYTQMVYG